MRVLLLLLAGCAPAWDESTVDGLRVLTRAGVAGPGGLFWAEVVVEEGETSLLLTTQVAEDRLVYVNHVYDPKGHEVFAAEDFWDSGQNRSNAAFSASVGVMNLPIDAAGPELSAGRWRFEVRVDEVGAPIDAAFVLKRDTDLASGTLRVNALIATDVQEDPDLRAGVEAALDLWETAIYPPFGLEVEITSTTTDLPKRIAAPGQGDADTWLALAEQKDLDQVNLVVTDQVTGGVDLLGIAGGIPGALVPTRSGAVALSAVSASEAAGADRSFNELEVEQFAETMAHEVGHYLGLFHPVEIPVGSAEPDMWDALADTPACTPFDQCFASLGENLMFPMPVLCSEVDVAGCDGFLPQRTLSDLQVALVQRYTGVR